MRDYREVTRDAVRAMGITSGLVEEYVAIIRDQERIIREQQKELDDLWETNQARTAQDQAANVMNQAIGKLGLA